LQGAENMAGWLKKIEEKVDLMDLPPSERARLCHEIREALRQIIQETKNAQAEKEEVPTDIIEVDEEPQSLRDYSKETKSSTWYNPLNRLL
jgi:uncharacterized coiled-coil DUF342 family protein